MAMTPYSGDPEVIAKLGTTPQERGLTPEQFKAKFDEGLKAFVEWFNLTHKTEFDEHLAKSVTDAVGVHGLELETGTFTPTLESDSGTFDNVYEYTYGFYIKQNKKIYYIIVIKITTKDIGMSGGIKLNGLPFAVASPFPASGAVGQFANITTGGKQLTFNVRTAVSFGRFYLCGDNTPETTLQASAIASGTSIYISGEYITS